MQKDHTVVSDRPQGFTLIELLIVIAIIAILAAILFPVFARSRENAKRMSCMSNMKQIGIGILQYVQDYDERFPMTAWKNANNIPTTRKGGDATVPAEMFDVAPDGNGPKNYSTWMDYTFPYVKNLQVYVCPSRPMPWTDGAMVSSWNGAYGNNYSGYFFPHYAYNAYISGWDTGNAQTAVKLSDINGPSGKFLITHNVAWPYLYSAVDDWGNSATPDMTLPAYKIDRNNQVWCHLDTTGVLFADGHVKVVLKGKAKYYSCNIAAGTARTGVVARDAVDTPRTTGTCGFWNPKMTPDAS